MAKSKADRIKARDQENTCPECGSRDVAGLVIAFYVALDEEGGPLNDVDWESESEIGPQRCCSKCNHEWEI